MYYLFGCLVLLWTVVGPLAFYKFVRNRSLRLLNVKHADNPVPAWQIIAMMVIAGPGTWLIAWLGRNKEVNDEE